MWGGEAGQPVVAVPGAAAVRASGPGARVQREPHPVHRAGRRGRRWRGGEAAVGGTGEAAVGGT
ncbi:hypothetical protein AB4212_29200, partial [Streptomyces sp. 2MCAF27]